MGELEVCHAGEFCNLLSAEAVKDLDDAQPFRVLVISVNVIFMDESALQHVAGDLLLFGVCQSVAAVFVFVQKTSVDRELRPVGIGDDVGIRGSCYLRFIRINMVTGFFRTGTDAGGTPSADGDHISTGDADVNVGHDEILCSFGRLHCQCIVAVRTSADTSPACHIGAVFIIRVAGWSTEGGHSPTADIYGNLICSGSSANTGSTVFTGCSCNSAAADRDDRTFTGNNIRIVGSGIISPGI